MFFVYFNCKDWSVHKNNTVSQHDKHSEEKTETKKAANVAFTVIVGIVDLLSSRLEEKNSKEKNSKEKNSKEKNSKEKNSKETPK